MVKGVTFYDELTPRDLPSNELFEICYPHGACQFIFPNERFYGNIREGLIIGEFKSLTGVNHILNHSNISKAYEDNCFPMICRYQASKRPSVDNYFIQGQKARSRELISNAESITIIGVQCSHEIDEHLWGPLAEAGAFIVYVEPGEQGQDRFRSWANGVGKVENNDFTILPKSFHDAFNDILRFNELS